MKPFQLSDPAAAELIDAIRWYEEQRSGLGAELFDAHVHVGRDIDGFVAPPDELVAFLQRSGASRAFAFCLDEPDRHPAFRAANDRTLAAAAASGGMLIPFVRLDLAESPLEEATRALDRRWHRGPAVRPPGDRRDAGDDGGRAGRPARHPDRRR